MARHHPLLALAFLVLACGGDASGTDGGLPDGGGRDGGTSDAGFIDLGPGTAPTISNALLTPDRVAQATGSGTVAVSLAVDYADPDGDLVTIRVATSSLTQESPLAGVAGKTQGTVRWALALPTAVVGQTLLQVVLVDSKGHLSNPLMVVFQVDTPAPTITFLNPQGAVTGGPAFLLTVGGTDFPPGAQVLWNGAPRPTTVLSASSLTAAIGPGDLSDAGVALVTVAGPSTTGGVSEAVTFGIGSVGTLVVNEPATDVVYDALRDRLYASVPSLAGARGNTILVVDPDAGVVLDAVFAGSEPGRLALSDDGHFLYVALDGAAEVKRFALPGFTLDLTFSLGADPAAGPYQAVDLQVAPGAPRTLAVSLGLPQASPRAVGGIAVFDDAVARTQRASDLGSVFDSLQWSPDAGALYAANGETNAFDYYTLAVDPAGVTQVDDLPGTFNHFDNRLRLDAESGRLYSGSGQVLEPLTGRLLGTFPTSGPMVVAPALASAYFLTPGSGEAGYVLSAYHLARFTPVDAVTLAMPPGFSQPPPRLVRWGARGLASCGGGHPLAIHSGPFLATPAPP